MGGWIAGKMANLKILDHYLLCESKSRLTGKVFWLISEC